MCLRRMQASLNENMLNKGSHLQVRFKYSDWAKQSVYEENSISKWTVLKIIKSIPSQEATENIKAVTEGQDLTKAKAIERIKKKIEQERLKHEPGASTDEPTAEDRLNWADTIDTDGDGVSNRYDVCISLANPNQEDTDNDRVGDACDSCPNDPAPRYENGCPLGVEPKHNN